VIRILARNALLALALAVICLVILGFWTCETIARLLGRRREPLRVVQVGDDVLAEFGDLSDAAIAAAVARWDAQQGGGRNG